MLTTIAAAGPTISSTASCDPPAATVTPDTPNAKFRSVPAIDADVLFDTVHVTDVTPPAHTASPTNTNASRGTNVDDVVVDSATVVVDAAVVVVASAVVGVVASGTVVVVAAGVQAATATDAEA